MAPLARSARRLLVGVVLAAAALAATGAAAATATPGPVVAPGAGACTDPKGVTVVVDFGALGGGVHVRCAGWPVRDGYEALRKAGFTVTDTARFPGLLCQIDGLPADQACVAAPPGDAHWGYSYATRGGSWTFSSQGALVRTPSEGSVEGWAFGRAARPSVAPPPPVPTTTTAAPPAPPTTAAPAAPAAPSGPTATASGPGPAPSVEEPGDDPSPDDVEPEGDPEEGAVADSSTTSTADRSSGGTEDADGAEALAAGQPADARRPAPDRGSPAPAVVTGVAVVALVGGGALVRRRRGTAG